MALPSLGGGPWVRGVKGKAIMALPSLGGGPWVRGG